MYRAQAKGWLGGGATPVTKELGIGRKSVYLQFARRYEMAGEQRDSRYYFAAKARGTKKIALLHYTTPRLARDGLNIYDLN